MEKFILAQLILSVPGAIATYFILLCVPDDPLLFIIISTIIQAVFLICTSILFGNAVQQLVGIDKMA